MEEFKGNDVVNTIDWDAWFNKPGMPIVKNNFNDAPVKVYRELADKWITQNGEGCTVEDINNFNALQVCGFIDTLLDYDGELSTELLEKIDATYGV